MTDPSFEDRREQLFGREADVHYLLERAKFKGLTTIVAGPLMGKTWVLTEAGRRLTECGKYVVGYHESRGQEISHLLHAVCDLYSRWLANSSMRHQAVSLWKRHKGSLVPRIGRMVGSLLESVSEISPAREVSKLVRAAFDSLTDVQTDLLSGGVEISPLAYDQAMSLVKLVADVSGRSVALILDAWELSPSKLAEYALMQAFLRHLDKWPHTHVYVAVRNPDVRSAQNCEEAFRLARNFRAVSAAAAIYPVSHMDLESEGEGARLVAHLRSRVPALSNVSEREVLDLVAGYPGVVDFWTTDPARSTMQTYEDLREQAANAHETQYTELDRLLADLDSEECELAALLALFPRLSAERWSAYRRFILRKKWQTSFHVLVDGQILIDENYPTYGHDTRHEAARRWFIQHRRPLMRRLANELIMALVVRVTGINAESHRILEALGALAATARSVLADVKLRALTVAAQLSCGDVAGETGPELDQAYAEAAALHRSAARLIGMGLVNRSARKIVTSGGDGAIADCAAVLELRGVPSDVKSVARFNAGVIKQQMGDIEGATAEYIKVIKSRHAPPRLVAGALINRADSQRMAGDTDGAIAGYTAACRLPGAPRELVMKALQGRVLAQDAEENWRQVIADCTYLIERHDDPEALAFALEYRAFARRRAGDCRGAVHDCTELIDLDGIAAPDVARARLNRGLALAQLDAMKEALGDFAAVIGDPAAEAASRAQALYARATNKLDRGDLEAAFDDYAAAANVVDVPAEMASAIRLFSGLRKGTSGFRERAIADLSAVIDEVPDASARLVQEARLFRALFMAEAGEKHRPIVDCTVVIESSDASTEQIGTACCLRAFLLASLGDAEGCMRDCLYQVQLLGVSPRKVVGLLRAAFLKESRLQHRRKRR
jgi:tetratricopeptide (TPR) repeat protein